MHAQQRQRASNSGTFVPAPNTLPLSPLPVRCFVVFICVSILVTLRNRSTVASSSHGDLVVLFNFKIKMQVDLNETTLFQMRVIKLVPFPFRSI